MAESLETSPLQEDATQTVIPPVLVVSEDTELEYSEVRAGQKRSSSGLLYPTERNLTSRSLPVSPLTTRHISSSTELIHISYPKSDSNIPSSLKGDSAQKEEQLRLNMILQNISKAQIYRKRMRRNNSKDSREGKKEKHSSGTNESESETSADRDSGSMTDCVNMEPDDKSETTTITSGSQSKGSFKKMLRDRYLSSKDASSGDDRHSHSYSDEQFMRLREKKPSETEDQSPSPRHSYTDDTSLSPLPTPSASESVFTEEQTVSTMRLPVPKHSILARTLTDPGYTTPEIVEPTFDTAVRSRFAFSMRMGSASSSSYMSTDLESDPFSPMVSPSPKSPISHSSGYFSPQSPWGSLPLYRRTSYGISPLAHSHAHVSQSPMMVSPRRLASPLTTFSPRQCQSAPQTPHQSTQHAFRHHFVFPPPSTPTMPLFRHPTDEAIRESRQARSISSYPPTNFCTMCSIQYPNIDEYRQHLLRHGLTSSQSVTNIRAVSPSSFGYRNISSSKQLTVPSAFGSTGSVSSHQHHHQAGSSTSTAVGQTPQTSGGSAHSPERPHSCRVCGRTFSRSDMLRRHARLHSGIKPYECNHCGQAFSRSDHLNTHLRTHTGEKPYVCPYCSYSACRKDMITRHMKVHKQGGFSGQSTTMEYELQTPAYQGQQNPSGGDTVEASSPHYASDKYPFS